MVSDNRRIVKNALALYLRMGVSMCTRIYTSRIVLQALGVMDYGLWNVVAGVIVMFGFLNVSMTGCTNRFIACELGYGKDARLQETFSAALTIHLMLVGVVVLLAETVGLWLLETQLVIPPARLTACRIVYQCSVFGAMAGIIQVPYQASILAHERMSIYAYMEIINVMLRLLFVVGLLYLFSLDNLIAMGAFTAAIEVLVLLTYKAFCERQFEGCRFSLSRDWQRMRPMLYFSGWDLYGNASVVARTQGVNVLINIFFSAVMNAACGVANNLQNAVMAFGRNVLVAFRPQIFRSFAEGDTQRICQLLYKSATYTTALMLLLVIPFEVEMDYILRLWLGNPPEAAATFSRLVLLFYLVIGVADVVMMGVHATGKIKMLSIVNGSLYMSVVPLSYLFFRLGAEAWWAFAICIVMALISLVFLSIHLHRLLPLFSGRRFLMSALRYAVIGALAFGCGWGVTHLFAVPSFTRLMCVGIVTTSLVCLGSFLWTFDADDRQMICSRIRKILFLRR